MTRGTDPIPSAEQLTRMLLGEIPDTTESLDLLWSLIYGELRTIANRLLSGETSAVDLSPTALVHEVWVRDWSKSEPLRWDNRRHLFGSMARSMERIIIDFSRRRRAVKRGGRTHREAVFHIDDYELALPEYALSEQSAVVLAALASVAETQPDCAEVARLRFVVGLPNASVARILNLSERTVRSRWQLAQCMMRDYLTQRGWKTL